MTRVSIIMRTFNSSETIGRILRGLRMQVFQDYELVVVDSGSTDGTLEEIKDYPHTFVDYSSEEFTYSGSLNTGIESAGGEYVVCLSHHCIPLHEEWLSNLVEAMDDEDLLAGAWGPLVFDQGSYQVGGAGIETMGLDEFLRQPNQGLQNPNSIIRRDLWKEHPFSNTVERCEDQEWAHHFMQQGYSTAMVRGAPALYLPKFGLQEYAASTYKNLMALNRMFGYVPTISTRQLLRQTIRHSGAAALGERSRRSSGLAISGIMGRWISYQAIRSGGLERIAEREARMRQSVAIKIETRLRGIKRRVTLARLALDGTLKVHPHQISPQGTVEPVPKTLFFLVGEMRSGTSWLSKTLDTHPEVFCKGEGTFFGRDQATEEIPVYDAPSPSLHNALAGNESFRVWHSLLWNGWTHGEPEEDLDTLVRATVDHYLDRNSIASGKRIVGDKSPLHTDYVDEIHDFYPEAKVIHIVRDGRDVAVSLMNHFWRMSRDQGGIFDLKPEELLKRDAYLADPQNFLKSGESIFTEERLRQMAVRWSRRVKKASAEGSSLFGHAYHQLRYEDLLRDPEKHLETIFDLLGARTDEKIVQHCVDQNRFERLAKRSSGNEDAASFYRKGVAGDWESVFTSRDRKVYESVAGEALLEFGYPLD